MRLSMPRAESEAYRTVSGWEMMVPGCMTHDLMEISARVIPRPVVEIALRLSACPMRATKIVTKDNSIVLAKPLHRIDAVAGGSLLPLVIIWPYRGLKHAIRSQKKEKRVE